MSNLTNLKDSSNNISCLEQSAKNNNEGALWLEKAFYWYQKAAENGNKIAMYNLAICYKNGEGTEKNLEKAFYWYQKAAEIGNKNAMYNLAICYENGKGTEKNLKIAFYWYQKAAENGNNNAMYNLAICYKNGKRTEKNLKKAFYWYQKAQNCKKAYFKLVISGNNFGMFIEGFQTKYKVYKPYQINQISYSKKNFIAGFQRKDTKCKL